MTKLEKVIKGIEIHLKPNSRCTGCPYDDCSVQQACLHQLMTDALELLKAQEPADCIPIDWLMRYAQLPTEFAISAWRKPKKEAEIEQAKSLDKPMSLDDALELLKEQQPTVDAVPVVRCKDCKHYKDGMMCFITTKRHNIHDNWFCADGEPK